MGDVRSEEHHVSLDDLGVDAIENERVAVEGTDEGNENLAADGMKEVVKNLRARGAVPLDHLRRRGRRNPDAERDLEPNESAFDAAEQLIGKLSAPVPRRLPAAPPVSSASWEPEPGAGRLLAIAGRAVQPPG